MSNPIYALTDHDHTEKELAPWLAECGTGDPMVDGLVLTALDCAWGHWARASKKPHRPFSDPEYLKAVAGLPWRWDDWIPAGLFGRGLNAAWWGRLVSAMDDLGRFGLSDTAIVRRDLTEHDESVLAIRDDWDLADFEACELSNPNGRTRANAWSTTCACWPRIWTRSRATWAGSSATTPPTRWPASSI